MRVMITGPPGAGKGTQAKMLAKRYNFRAISVGSLLRQEAEEKTVMGKRIKQALLKGDMVPDKLVDKVMRKRIKPHHDNFLFDGFPRDLNQVKHLHFKIDMVIFIRLSQKEVIKRLVKRKRMDDKPEVIKHRLKVYTKMTKPVIAYFIKKKIPVIAVNGNQSIKKVFGEMTRRLDEKIQVC